MASGSAERWARSISTIGELEDFIRSYDLECVVCLESLTSTPVNQCKRGHLICSKCHDEVESCPTCQGNLNRNDKIRNLFLERIVQDLPKVCKNNKNGCREILAEGSKHEAECDYRLTPSCPVYGLCKAKVLFKDILAHVNEAHRDEVHSVHGNDNKIILGKKMKPELFQSLKNYWTWFSHVLKSSQTDLEQKLFMDVVDQKEEIFYFWTYINGTPKEAEKFECTLKLTDKDGNKLCFTKRAVSVDKGRDDVMREAKACFMLPAALVKNQFWNRDDERLRGEIKIRKVAASTPATPPPTPPEEDATEQQRMARKRPRETRPGPKFTKTRRNGDNRIARNSR